MAANGLMYTASFKNVSVTAAAQNLWEFIAGTNVSILIHSIRITFSPTITSGVAQDVRAQINIQTISTTGTGGTAATAAAVNTRNTVTAATTCNYLVTTPGTAGTVKDAELVTIIAPFERIYTADQRIPVSGGSRLAINLGASLGAAYNASSEIYFEEI